jgi:signal transduction histidine kinase
MASAPEAPPLEVTDHGAGARGRELIRRVRREQRPRAHHGRPAELSRRFRLGQLLALAAAGPAIAVTAAVVFGIIAIAHQNVVRTQLLQHVEPANAASLRLLIAMDNQETGIRGYELTGDDQFLAPYHLGVSQERKYAQIIRTDAVSGTRGDLGTALARIRTWEKDTAVPALSRRPGAAAPPARIDTSRTGTREFDDIRSSLGVLQDTLLARVKRVKAELNHSATGTEVALAVIAAALIVSVLSAGLLLRRWVTRPINRLASSARRVSDGELSHSVVLAGPRDLETLSEDVDAMRLALLSELTTSRDMQDALASAATELQRSNTELEAFAYVASHDLQEPLRKVTSFCQLLESRYSDQLDERGLQYIGFAVDGAKRMQQLVNDLLAFSRVGRQGQTFTPTPLGDLAASAVADLQGAIEESAAEVVIGALPTLPVAPALMRAVFQNLLANAIKFRSEAAPRAELSAERDGDGWRFSCADNGIGIESDYAERIFIIFQRLHTREAYPGTGIGLAMCRKIVEHHGGRMWLDQAYTGGTRMYFTLPDEPTAPTVGSQSQ